MSTSPITDHFVQWLKRVAQELNRVGAQSTFSGEGIPPIPNYPEFPVTFAFGFKDPEGGVHRTAAQPFKFERVFQYGTSDKNRSSYEIGFLFKEKKPATTEDLIEMKGVRLTAYVKGDDFKWSMAVIPENPSKANRFFLAKDGKATWYPTGETDGEPAGNMVQVTDLEIEVVEESTTA